MINIKYIIKGGVSGRTLVPLRKYSIEKELK